MNLYVRVYILIAIISLAAHANERPFVLPEWFEATRVQAHSEHSLKSALKLTPQAHAKAIRSLGANVLTRIFLNCNEGAWWPSKVGQTNPLIGERDFAAEITDAVHAEGMQVIAYHRHMSDEAMQTRHPDWVCKHRDGSPVLEPRKKTKHINVLCMNSPYRDYIKTRLVELADRGVDCIYFDSWHMPDICACDYCKKLFREETGRDLDLTAPIGSPAYLNGVDFVNRSMVRAFGEWREAVRAKHPHVFFAISSSRYPMFFSPHMDMKLLAISDTSKTEFHKPFGFKPEVMKAEPDFAPPVFDDQLALGWSIVRDASDGRPPLMWIPFIRNERTSLYSSAAAVTYGCIASMNINIRKLPEDAESNQAIFRSTFDMGKKVSPYLAYARPIPWAIIHISERSRNARLVPKDSKLVARQVRFNDFRKMWREVFSPELGAFQALKEEHIPWVTLTDDALSQGLAPDSRLLILPWPEELNTQQQKTVERFEKQGGYVIRINPAANWHTKSEKSGLVKNLRRIIRQQSGSAPIQIDGPERMHTVCYHNPNTKRYTVCLANTWGWFRSTRVPDPKLNQGTEPLPCTGVAIKFSKSIGQPKKVFEVLSGKQLIIKPSDNDVQVQIPEFQIMACVVAEY